MSKLAYYRTLGFAGTHSIPFTRKYRILCNSCDALVINGYPSHEQGCQNATHECRGCNAIIPARQRYCADCR